MNEAQLNDLKQFIAATVSQATAHLATKDDLADDIAGAKSDIAKLNAKIDDLDLKLATIAETLHENLNNHEVRITKLERQTA